MFFLRHNSSKLSALMGWWNMYQNVATVPWCQIFLWYQVLGAAMALVWRLSDIWCFWCWGWWYWWWCWCCLTWEKFEWFEDRLHIKRLALFWPTVAKHGMLVNVTKSCFLPQTASGKWHFVFFVQIGSNGPKMALNGPKSPKQLDWRFDTILDHFRKLKNMPGSANFGRKWSTSNLLQNCKNAFFKLSSFTDRYSTLSSAVTSTWVRAQTSSKYQP